MEKVSEEWSPKTAQFSLYAAGISKREGQHPYRHGTLRDVYLWMNSMKMMQITRELRDIKDKERQKEFKRDRLPFATFSGTFSYRNQEGLIRHSGLICFDFDHLGGKEKVWQARKMLEKDPYFETMLMFTSPRGDGVKWVTHVDLDRGDHKKWCTAISRYLLLTYGLEADASPTNVASSCFLCWDANVVIHPSFGLF